MSSAPHGEKVLSPQPTHLRLRRACAATPERARESVRFSLGIYNSDEEVDYLLKHLPPIIQKLRDISPLNPDHPDNDRYDVAGARAKHEQELAIAKDQEAIAA